MKQRSRRNFLGAIARTVTVATMASGVVYAAASEPYVCPPCGCKADEQQFPKPGKCPACGMALIKKSAAKKLAPVEPK